MSRAANVAWRDAHPLLPVLVGLAALLLTVTVVRWAGVGPASVAAGRIKSIGEVPYRRGRWRYMVVELPGGAVRVDSATPKGCGVGDRIRVRRELHLLGPSYTAEPIPCAAP